jgi:hypothetical protein
VLSVQLRGQHPVGLLFLFPVLLYFVFDARVLLFDLLVLLAIVYYLLDKQLGVLLLTSVLNLESLFLALQPTMVFVKFLSHVGHKFK